MIKLLLTGLSLIALNNDAFGMYYHMFGSGTAASPGVAAASAPMDIDSGAGAKSVAEKNTDSAKEQYEYEFTISRKEDHNGITKITKLTHLPSKECATKTVIFPSVRDRGCTCEMTGSQELLCMLSASEERCLENDLLSLNKNLMNKGVTAYGLMDFSHGRSLQYKYNLP